MLQITLPFIAGPITHVVNVSFERGVVPQQWKMCSTFPLPKKNVADKSALSLENLRPITILPICLKVAESIFNSQFSTFVEGRKLLPPVQSGFRKGYSTTTALCNTLDDIISSTDKGHLTSMTLLDLSKAFDSVNLVSLIDKLKFHGVTGRTLQWLVSYLNDRVQYTVINTHRGHLRSDGKPISSGVPQGSILGPLLFSLYVADLPKAIQHCKVQLFADDVQLYLSFPPHEARVAEERINSDLKNINEWLRINSLVINPSKCQNILFGSGKNRCLTPALNIHIDGVRIPSQHFVKNLGVIMDSELSFSRNISQICQKAYFSLRQLLPFKYVLDSQTKLLLCESLVLSLLNYGDIIYGPCISYADNRRLQKMQNLCLRFITYIPPFSHVTPYLRNLKCLNMRERRLVHYVCFLNSILKSQIPGYLYDKMSKRSSAHDLNLRHVNSTLNIPKHSTSLFRCSFSYLSTYIYNSYLSKLPNSSNLTLKRALKNGILSDCLEVDLSLF